MSRISQITEKVSMTKMERDVSDYLSCHRKFVVEWYKNQYGLATLAKWVSRKKSEQMQQRSKLASALLIWSQASAAELLEDKTSKRKITPDISQTEAFRQLVEKSKNPALSHSTGVREVNLEDVQTMREDDLFFKFVREVAVELDIDWLCFKMMYYVNILTNCDRGSLFLVRRGLKHSFLVSKIFDVTQGSTLKECLCNESNRMIIPIGKGILGQVALTKQTVSVVNAYEHPDFNKEIDKLTGYTTKSILCLPVLSYNGEVVGVAEIINKKGPDNKFLDKDVVIFKKYLSFCGIGISNAETIEDSISNVLTNQHLLTIAKGIFLYPDELEKLVSKMLNDAGPLLKGDKCNIFITDQIDEIKSLTVPEEVRFSKMFELDMMEKKRVLRVYNGKEIKDSKTMLLAKKFVFHGGNVNELKNLDSKYSEEDGFFVRNIMAFPFLNTRGICTGVLQVINYLTETDIINDLQLNALKSFAILCAIAVSNNEMYCRLLTIKENKNTALQVISNHTIPSRQDIGELRSISLGSDKEIKLFQYDFDYFLLNDLELGAAVDRVFETCGLRNTFKIAHLKLWNWIMSVKRSYRQVIYHNWRHGFNVFQTMATILYTSNLKRYYTDLEILGLLVACLCHDLDHRGTNNAFQNKILSPIAQLYSTSTMEHHHADMAIYILNWEDSNIFHNLSSADYEKVLGVIKEAILATDLALYVRKKGLFVTKVSDGQTNWNLQENKELLFRMLMTACDLAGICKPFPMQLDIAAIVSEEFYMQGDLERSLLKTEPIPMMDRNKKDQLPKMQVGFIDFVCSSLYQSLADFDVALSPLLNKLKANREFYQVLAQEQEEKDKEAAEEKKRSIALSTIEEERKKKMSTMRQSVSGAIPEESSKVSKCCSVL